ncbi:MAG TPA: limonene-1,2-epoxide hydrolase family protein [Pseudomonadales bacterium]|nr:limonene-1,2-epoxide hydrolase family protein [Pseudomonadales bacterium]
MLNFTNEESVELEEFVYAFAGLDFDYFERHFSERLRWKNPGFPALNKNVTMKVLRAMLKVMPGFHIDPIHYEQQGNQIIIERHDYIPLGKWLEIKAEVTGVFTFEGNQVVYWEERFSYLQGASAFVKALLALPQKIIAG